MKVTHVEDHVTHAVISGAQAIDFGISDSPEFFNILSSTLYTDQKLAVIRETLCNAWDAHIEFKCEHLAVDITLNDEYLVIRDYGPGIAPKMIGPVYGTYGGSTKASNGQVTGGFGLGCKAPFAYVDDFEVTSYHDGKMTIYRLSKSNAEVGGKPSIVPVVQNIPTQEHGLQVKIAVKNDDDRRRFRDLIFRIVQNGAMKMKLNGNELPTLPFDDMQHGFMLTRKAVQENFCAVTIRYGNVIYPIQREETYSYEWDQIVTFLNRLSSGNRHRTNQEWSLVLQAAPNTVSVTPSRESLSNQKHTLETITSLMREFLAVKDKGLHTECFRILDENIDNTWLVASPAVLFNTEDRIPNLHRNVDRFGRRLETAKTKEIGDRDNLVSFPQFVEQYAYAAYPDFSGFKKKDRLSRINALIQSGFGGTRGKKLLKTYRREYLADAHRPRRHKRSKERYGVGEEVNSPWFHREVIAPLIKGMTKESTLKADKLFVNTLRRGYGQDKLVPVDKYKPERIEAMWPFARNIVILSFNKMDVLEGNADNHGIAKFWLGTSLGSLVYIVPRAEAKVDAAREYFTKMGVHLIDLTVDQHETYVAKQKAYVETPTLKRPKKNGIPVLGKMVGTEGYYYNLTDTSEIDRITAPKFIMKDGRRNQYESFEKIPSKADTKLILEMFGSEGGLCANQNQYDRYKNAGALDWTDYILDKLVEEYTNNPRIREYLPHDHTRLERRGWNSAYYGMGGWLEIIEADKDLFEYFGLVDNRTEYDKNIMKVNEIFRSNYLSGHNGQRVPLDKVLEDIKLSSELKEVASQIKHSKLIKILDEEGVRQVLVKAEAYGITEKQRVIARDALLQAIEG